MNLHWLVLSVCVGLGTAQNCKCVLYYLCKNNTIVTDGRAMINERFGEVDPCTCTCPDAPSGQKQRCCLLLDDDDSSTSGNATTLLPPPEPPVSPVTRSPSQATSKGCGESNPGGVGSYRIGNAGDGPLFGQYPWMAALLIGPSLSHRCGGSLIHPSVVLTAAHCVTKKQPYTVRVGEYDSSNTRELLKHQDRQVTSIKIHEGYKPGIYYNDLALLFVSTPFELSDHVNIACLPPADFTTTTEECVATGWGKDKWGVQGKYPAILRQVILPFVPHADCQERLRKTVVGPFFKLNKSFLCAGGEVGKDTCVGDGGGPLMCRVPGSENKYQQIGVTSWGVECNGNHPGVYANLAFARTWIDKQMRDNGFDPKVYEY